MAVQIDYRWSVCAWVDVLSQRTPRLRRKGALWRGRWLVQPPLGRPLLTAWPKINIFPQGRDGRRGDLENTAYDTSRSSQAVYVVLFRAGAKSSTNCLPEVLCVGGCAVKRSIS